MTEPNFIELILTCGSWQEAQRIADALLEKHFVACVEFIPVKSRYHWKQKLEEAEEVRLIMQTRADYFAKIEAVVKKLHSYETPNLHAIPIAETTDEIRAWLEEEANDRT